MKKFIAHILTLVILMGTSVTAFASTMALGSDDFYSQVDGDYRVVTKRVDGKNQNFTVTGYYFADQSKEVFRIMNLERTAAGLPKLAWESELVQPAIQRALEQYVAKSHTRPNGKNGLTVSTLAHGENLAGGDIDAADVMDGWMNSPGHRSNILDTDFTGVAVACVETDDMCFWVQLFHADKAAGTKTSSAQGTDKAEGSESGVSASAMVSALEKAKTSSQKTSVTIKNKSSISASALKAISDWGVKNRKTVSLNATTSGANGKGVQGQITLNPAKFVSVTENLKLGVRVDDESVSSVRALFDRVYKNNIAVIKLDHTGSLVSSAGIAAKVDLTALNTETLVFYSYNPSTKKLSKLPVTGDGYSVDKNKYLRFNTTRGGYIIVTDKDLERA